MGRYLDVTAAEEVQSLKGMLRKPRTAVSVEWMSKVVAKRGAAGR